MKKLLIKIILPFLVTVISLSIPQISLATDDICILGSSAVNMTVREADKFYEDKLDGFHVTGTGKVLRVVQQGTEGTNENVTIDAECSNGVRLVLHVDTFWVNRNNAKKGSMLRFSWRSVRLKKHGSKVTCIVEVTN
ncbi:MAG: hypothetical protein JRI75_09325 [Deltaproteobacteria bacterium]|nr:hypothetical protein [Deltaproteobacteria bacterium]